jgi:peptidoglycan/LPS O-acetylase OafA/YrhL
MPQTVERQHYIDWVRVLAFLILIFFHCAMPFATFGWEVKNADTSVGLTRFLWWLHQWRLPLLFFISGAGISFSLRKRSIPAFAGERFVRLFIPLLFAMFFTIPLQVYVERLQAGRFSGSYLQFYPSVWTFIPYPEGTLTWSHMWFVVYLFTFCLLLLPVFALFKLAPLAALKARVSDLLARPVLTLLLCAPFVLYYLTLYLRYPEEQNLLDDWYLFVTSITLLVYGYLLGGNPLFWRTCEKYRYLFAGIAAGCAAALFYGFWWKMELPKVHDARLTAYGVLNSLHVWTLILALLGFAKKYLNFSSPFLKYANQAVYPYYILHQTVIVGFGYLVVQWRIPILPKLLVLIVLCFATLAVLYEWPIRRFALTRVLYGLRNREMGPTVANIP